MPISDIFIAAIKDLLLILAMYILGSYVLLLIRRRISWSEIISVGFPIGAGLLSFSAFVVSFIGFQLSLITLFVIYFLLFVFISIVAKRNSVDIQKASRSLVKTIKTTPQWLPKGWIFRAGLFTVLGIFFWTVILSVGRSYSTWDGLETWSVKGYGIAQEGTILAADTYGSFDRAYPLNTPILIAFFRYVSGDILPGSKMIFPLLAVSFLFGSYRYWRTNNVSPEKAMLGVLLFLTIPLFFRHMMVGMADLPFACYFLLAIFWSMEGLYTQDSSSLLISRLLLGFSCWTRPEGFLYCVGAIITLLIAARLTRLKRPKILPWLLPLVIISTFWLAFSLSDVSESNLGQASRSSFLTILQDGIDLHIIWIILLHILRRSLDPSLWGFYIPICILLIAFGWRKLFSISESLILMNTLLLLFVFAVPIVLFYIGTTHYGLDFLPGWLDRSFDRAFFSALLLVGVLAVTIVGKPKAYVK
jgi:hypothetical protein